jgi:hypothetical protein
MTSSEEKTFPVDESVFVIGDSDSEEDDLRLAVEGVEDGTVQNAKVEGVQTDKKDVKSNGIFVSKMEDHRNNYTGENIPTVRQPRYQLILATGSDDEEGQPRLRKMLGFAAHHGSKLIPAEIKDNVEHFLANTPTAPPRLHVAPPANLWKHYGY